MTEITVNSRACSIALKSTDWTLRKYPSIKHEGCVLIPHRVSDPEQFTGLARKGVGAETLIVSATAGTGESMYKANVKANASALRAAQALSEGKDIPKGKIADEFNDAAEAAMAAILKEEGLTQEAYIVLLDAFIMAANPPGPKTLHSVILEPGAPESVLVRVSYTDDVNMSSFLKRFPDSVLENGAGTDQEVTVADSYRDWLKGYRAAKIEKDLAKIQSQRAKAEERIAKLTSKAESLQKQVS